MKNCGTIVTMSFIGVNNNMNKTNIEERFKQSFKCFIESYLIFWCKDTHPRQQDANGEGRQR